MNYTVSPISQRERVHPAGEVDWPNSCVESIVKLDGTRSLEKADVGG